MHEFEWAVGTPADQQWLRAASKVLSPFYNGPEDAGYIYQCTGLITSSEQKTSGKKKWICMSGTYRYNSSLLLH